MPTFAQSDRGTITGTVLDPANAVVPGAKIAATNTQTGVKIDAVATDTGNYTLTSLPAGVYDVNVEAPGFKKTTQKGVEVQVAQTTRTDLRLEVGSSTDTVTITGEAPMLRTENAETSMNVTGEKVNNLPLNFGGGGGAGGGIRNWLSFIALAPGISGENTNSPGQNTINGVPSGSYGNFKVYLEGQDSTSANDAGWTSQVAAASVETIGEFSVQTSNFSPKFGQVAGGMFNFTTKSGTNQYHGSAYEYRADERYDLDAHHPFSHGLDRDRKNDYGFSVGGPIWIPKLYNGRNKTFFFFNIERFANNQLSSSSYSTVPTAAYRTGDFSAALTGKTLTDPTSGLQFPENAIYDPNSTYTDAKGNVLRTQFPNNVIPSTSIDKVAQKIQLLIPQPVNSQTTLNWLPNVFTNTQQQIPSLKLDQSLGDKTRLSFFWNQQHTNQIAAPDGLPVPLSQSRPKIVGSNQYRINADHTFSPTLVAHLGVGFLRFINPDSAPPAELNYDALGLLGLVGSATNPAGFPYLSGLGVNNAGGAGNYGPSTADHQYTDKLSFVASTTYVRGNHTYEVGAEVKQDVYSDQNVQGSQGQYTFGNSPTAVPFLQTSSVGGGSIGAGYATFLLGQATVTNVNQPRNNQMRTMNWSWYVGDNWKITHKLTMDYGVRWDYTPMGHEEYYRESEIGLHTPNPSAGGLPGGYVFEGYGAGRCNCQFSKAYPFAFGPRLGVAYQIDSKTVFRGGWGITYSGGDSWGYINGGMPVAGLGFNSVTNSTGYGFAVSQFSNGIVYDPSVLSAVTLNPGIAPFTNVSNPSKSSLSAAPAWGPQYRDPNGGRPSRINQWNIALQREIAKNTTIEAAYVGNRGVWEESRSLTALNAISPARVAALGLDLTNPATRALLTSQIGSTTAKNAGYSAPYAGFPTTASVAQSLRPFPEYNDGLATWFAPLGNSWYDALQMKFTTRDLVRGLDVTSSFTYSKELCLGSVGCPFVQDAFNRQENKSLGSTDTPFISTTAFTYRTPMLTENKFIRQLTGGWTWGGILRYANGNLIGTPSSRTNLNTWTFNTNTRFNRVPGVPLTLLDPNCKCIDPNNAGQQILNPAAWSDTPTGTWGQGAAFYNDYRWQHRFSENMNFGRRFHLKEQSRMYLEVRAEFFNVFNRVYLPTPSSGNPTATLTTNTATGAPTGGYGYITNTSGIGGQRNGQLMARFEF